VTRRPGHLQKFDLGGGTSRPKAPSLDTKGVEDGGGLVECHKLPSGVLSGGMAEIEFGKI